MSKTLCISIIIISFLISFHTSVVGQKLYKTSWTQVGTIYGTSAVLLGGSHIIEKRKGPITLQDLSNLDRSSINSFDRNTTFNFSPNASLASDYLKYGLYAAPVALFLSDQGRENFKEIMIMYSEVFYLNGALTGFTKSAVGRYRPYAYNDNVSLDLKLTETTRKSFFSGHTSQASSLSFMTATIFDDLYPDSDWRYAVWAGASTAPAVMGYLRIKGGRHYPTDVIVGYGVGALVGYFTPELHKITRETNVSIIGSEGGLGIVYTF